MAKKLALVLGLCLLVGAVIAAEDNFWDEDEKPAKKARAEPSPKAAENPPAEVTVVKEKPPMAKEPEPAPPVARKQEPHGDVQPKPSSEADHAVRQRVDEIIERGRGDERDLRGDEHHLRGDAHRLRGDEHHLREDEQNVRGDEHHFIGDEHHIRGDEHHFLGDEHNVRGDEHHSLGEEHHVRGNEHHLLGAEHHLGDAEVLRPKPQSDVAPQIAPEEPRHPERYHVADYDNKQERREEPEQRRSKTEFLPDNWEREQAPRAGARRGRPERVEDSYLSKVARLSARKREEVEDYSKEIGERIIARRKSAKAARLASSRQMARAAAKSRAMRGSAKLKKRDPQRGTQLPDKFNSPTNHSASETDSHVDDESAHHKSTTITPRATTTTEDNLNSPMELFKRVRSLFRARRKGLIGMRGTTDLKDHLTQVQKVTSALSFVLNVHDATESETGKELEPDHVQVVTRLLGDFLDIEAMMGTINHGSLSTIVRKSANGRDRSATSKELFDEDKNILDCIRRLMQRTSTVMNTVAPLKAEAKRKFHLSDSEDISVLVFTDTALSDALQLRGAALRKKPGAGMESVTELLVNIQRDLRRIRQYVQETI